MGSSWSRPRCSRAALALGLVTVLAGCSTSAASVLNTTSSSAKASSSRLAVGSVTLTTVSFNWNWVEQRPKASPSARDSYAMAYDAATKQLILFGGLTNLGEDQSTTWAWTGARRLLIYPDRQPQSDRTSRIWPNGRLRPENRPNTTDSGRLGAFATASVGPV